MGRKYSPEKYPSAIREAILNRIKLGAFSSTQIGEQLGKSPDQIQVLLKAMAAEGTVTLTDTHRIERTPVQLRQSEYKVSDSLQSFIDSYPSVKKWADDLKVRNSGEPIVEYRRLVSHVKTVSDLLKTSPEAFLASKEIAQQFFTSFLLEWQKSNSTGTHSHLMALRNYCMTNGVVWPRGVSGLMSGKKVNYGVYAHVQLSDAQIKKGIELSQTWGDTDLRDWFAMGCEAGWRHVAGRDCQISTYEVHEGYSTMRAYESKTKKSQGVWTKYFVNPTVQRFLMERIERQKAAGQKTLFGNHITEDQFSEKMNARLRELYTALGVVEPYCFKEPTHSLRHFAAHHWLRITKYNYSLVAKILGWKSEATLREAYGEMPGDFILSELKELGKGELKW